MPLLARNSLQIASNSLVKCLESFSEKMKVLIAISLLLAVATASPVSPVLVPKVQVAPAQVTVVKQPYTIAQPEPVYRSVPVPVKAVTYTAPQVVPGPVITPAVYAAPAPAVAYAAPAAVAYTAPAAVAYPAPAAVAYSAAAPHYVY